MVVKSNHVGGMILCSFAARRKHPTSIRKAVPRAWVCRDLAVMLWMSG